MSRTVVAPVLLVAALVAGVAAVGAGQPTADGREQVGSVSSGSWETFRPRVAAP